MLRRPVFKVISEFVGDFELVEVGDLTIDEDRKAHSSELLIGGEVPSQGIHSSKAPCFGDESLPLGEEPTVLVELAKQ